jgi:hypothetical protein
MRVWVMMKKLPETRAIEITVSCQRLTVWLWCRTATIAASGAKKPRETRVIRMTMAAEPTNDELMQYAEAMARFCVDPARRRFKPPKAMVWREVATGDVQAAEHGEARDGTPFPMDELPVEGGFPAPSKTATILTAAEAGKGSAAKRLRSSPKEPTTRNLGKGRHRALPGG